MGNQKALNQSKIIVPIELYMTIQAKYLNSQSIVLAKQEITMNNCITFSNSKKRPPLSM